MCPVDSIAATLLKYEKEMHYRAAIGRRKNQTNLH